MKLFTFCLVSTFLLFSAHASENIDWGKLNSIKELRQLSHELLIPLKNAHLDLNAISDLPGIFQKLDELEYAQTQIVMLRSWSELQFQMRFYQIAQSKDWKREIDLLLSAGKNMETDLLAYFSELSNVKNEQKYLRGLPPKRIRDLRVLGYNTKNLEWSKNLADLQAYLAEIWIQKHGCRFEDKKLATLEINALQTLEVQANLTCTDKTHISKIKNLVNLQLNSPKVKFKKAMEVLERRGIILKNSLVGQKLEKRGGNLFRVEDFQGEEVGTALKTLGLDKLGNPHRKDAVIFYSQVFMPPIVLPKEKAHILLPQGMEGQFFSIRLYDYIKLNQTKSNEEKDIQRILLSHGLTLAPGGQLGLTGEAPKINLTELLNELKKAQRTKVKTGLNPFEKLPFDRVMSDLEKLHTERRYVVSVGQDLLALPPQKAVGNRTVVNLMTTSEYQKTIDATVKSFDQTVSEMSKYLKDHEGIKGNYSRYWTKVSEEYNVLEKTSPVGSIPRRVIFQQQLSILKQCLKRLERLGAFDLLSSQSVTMNLTPAQKKAMKDLVPYLESSERDLESMMVTSMAVIPLLSVVAVVGVVKLPVVALFAALIGGGIESGRQVVEITIDGSRKEVNLKEIYQNTLIGAAFANVAPYEKLRPFLLVSGAAMSAHGIVKEIENGQFGVATYDAAVSGIFLGAAVKSSLKKGPVPEAPSPKGQQPPPPPQNPKILSSAQKAILKIDENQVVYLSELTSAEYNKISHLIPKTNTTSPAQNLILEVVERRVQTARQKMQNNGKVVTVFEEEVIRTPTWRSPVAQGQTTAPRKLESQLSPLISTSPTSSPKGHWDPRLIKELANVQIASKIWKNPFPENYKINERWSVPPQKNSTAADRTQALAERNLRERLTSRIVYSSMFDEYGGHMIIGVPTPQPRFPDQPVRNPLFTPRDENVIAMREALAEATSDADADLRNDLLADSYNDSLEPSAHDVADLIKLSLELKSICDQRALHSSCLIVGPNLTEENVTRVREIVKSLNEIIKRNYEYWFRGTEFRDVERFFLEGGTMGVELSSSATLESLVGLNRILSHGIKIRLPAIVSNVRIDALFRSGIMNKARDLGVSIINSESDFMRRFLAETWPRIEKLSVAMNGDYLADLLFQSGRRSLPNLRQLSLLVDLQRNTQNMSWYRNNPSMLSELERFSFSILGLTNEFMNYIETWYNNNRVAIEGRGRTTFERREVPGRIDIYIFKDRR